MIILLQEVARLFFGHRAKELWRQIVILTNLPEYQFNHV
jgi:hypothetical protein